MLPRSRELLPARRRGGSEGRPSIATTTLAS
jgi:hypothetical protein